MVVRLTARITPVINRIEMDTSTKFRNSCPAIQDTTCSCVVPTMEGRSTRKKKMFPPTHATAPKRCIHRIARKNQSDISICFHYSIARYAGPHGIVKLLWLIRYKAINSSTNSESFSSSISPTQSLDKMPSREMKKVEGSPISL